jgi:hypothetical protein
VPRHHPALAALPILILLAPGAARAGPPGSAVAALEATTEGDAAGAALSVRAWLAGPVAGVARLGWRSALRPGGRGPDVLLSTAGLRLDPWPGRWAPALEVEVGATVGAARAPAPLLAVTAALEATLSPWVGLEAAAGVRLQAGARPSPSARLALLLYF